MSEPDSISLVTLRCPREIDRRTVRQFCLRLREEVAGGREFTCLLTDDRELQRLNREFLARDYPTDVLSFPSGVDDPLGEMAISVQRAREQALEFGHSTEDEIRILMLHGLLHLLGMDHEADRGRMARAEKRWRQKLGLPGGLIERARQ
jgi:probable rRNA maturation factor